MERVVISIEDMANILMHTLEEPDVVSREYCETCLEMNNGCLNPGGEKCPHEPIVEYRFFIRTHFRKYIVRG